ncbi:MAG: universal stress protein [Planctomycetaceae bacterium]|nr:universal stress protein [Planctomycetaceae bacterium]
MKILIGVDGSAASLDAARLAAALVNPATDGVAVYFSPLELEKRLPGRKREVVDGAAAALFEEICGLLPRGCVRQPEMICSSKSAAVGILESAAEWKADLVVVGARGHGSLERLFLGSVSRAVVHGANLPVLVVRAAPPDDRGLRVLACHHPASAAAIARVAGHLTWPGNAVGQVIAVTESMLAGPVPEWVRNRVRDPAVAAMAGAWQEEHDAEVAAVGGHLEAFQKTLPAGFQKTAPIIAEGNPGDRILERVKADGIDLVVLGRTPTDALSRWLLGSTSEAVLTNAPCSVLLVPVEKPV